MKFHNFIAVAAAMAAFCFCLPASAQQQDTSPFAFAGQGLTFSERFEGSSGAGANIFDMNTAVGYDFTSFLGADVGVPVFLETPAVATKLFSSETDGFGNVYGDLRFTWQNSLFRLTSLPSIAFPTARATQGLSVREVIFNWSNQIDRSFGRFTPYLNAAPGNGLESITYSNARLVERPYVAVGKEVQFIGGSLVRLPSRFALRADAYDVVPWGQQEIIGPIARRKQATIVGGAQRNGFYDLPARRKGGPALAEDNGFDAAVDVTPRSSVLFEVGYDYSAHYALGTLFFSAGYTFSNLLSRHRSSRHSSDTQAEDPLSLLLSPR